jgi:CRISPR/Cas system-associated exonuclease Cas4 (RecB family)
VSSAVKKGQLAHWSPSQVTRHSRCNRRWYFEKVLKPPVPPEETDAMRLGTAVHKQLETWIKKGTQPDHPLAQVALPYLPDRATRLLEAEASLTNPPLVLAGVKAKGFIDLRDFTDPDHIAVWDYKTKKKLQYALTREELKRDVQLITYAHHSRLKFGARSFTVYHLTIQTEGTPAAKPVPASLSPMEIDDVLASVEREVEGIKQTATAVKLEDVKPNAAACNDYGKLCPFWQFCLGASSATQAPPAGTTTATGMSLKERIMAEQARVRAVGINPPDAARHVLPLKLYVDCAPSGTYTTVAQLRGDSDATTFIASLNSVSGTVVVKSADVEPEVMKALEDRAGANVVRPI